jgi:DNA-binding ferritin-like protein
MISFDTLFKYAASTKPLKDDSEERLQWAVKRVSNSKRTPTNSQLTAISENILDSFIGKQKPSKELDAEDCELLSVYAAMLRALYLVHHQNHLETTDHGLHLLFKQLYEDATGMADDAGERVVGLCGELVHQDLVGKFAEHFIVEDKGVPEKHIESSISAEHSFQIIAKKVYDRLKEKEALTLGLDDLIMSQASESEGHIYLLQQARKKI